MDEGECVHLLHERVDDGLGLQVEGPESTDLAAKSISGLGRRHSNQT